MGNRIKLNRANCQSKLEAIVSKVGKKDSVSMEADLVHDLGFDSVTMMKFIIAVEDTFGVIIGGKEIEANVLQTLTSLMDFILSN